MPGSDYKNIIYIFHVHMFHVERSGTTLIIRVLDVIYRHRFHGRSKVIMHSDPFDELDRASHPCPMAPKPHSK